MSRTSMRLIRQIFFFFQAEDGIRDLTVTGVQTCALPIFAHSRNQPNAAAKSRAMKAPPNTPRRAPCHPGKSTRLAESTNRSEERRVGKEWRSRWTPDD